ncbi:hypothetical protein GCM10009782_11980 [Glycomyces algeriensis]
MPTETATEAQTTRRRGMTTRGRAWSRTSASRAFAMRPTRTEMPRTTSARFPVASSSSNQASTHSAPAVAPIVMSSSVEMPMRIRKSIAHRRNGFPGCASSPQMSRIAARTDCTQATPATTRATAAKMVTDWRESSRTPMSITGRFVESHSSTDW